ncbi:MAG: MoaD/ThiS family protein [Flavobacteriaceae bacterium]|nr:MoaD/ThiS family protein [Flavobacteriaceae bacterium]
MRLTIKYFGLLAEVTQCSEEQFEFSGMLISELLETIYLKHPKLKEKDFQVAQNQIIVTNETEISGRDIALLPPFSGG